VGILVNGIKALVFGGLPGALVGGLSLDKVLGLEQFTLSHWSQDKINEIYFITGKKMECVRPTLLGDGRDSYIVLDGLYEKDIDCNWYINESWVVGTAILAVVSAFWVYHYLSKK